MKATGMKNSYQIGILLNRGADPNAEDDEGVTPFYLLFRNSFRWESDILKVTEVFINAGANPVHSSPYGNTPIYQAARIYERNIRTKVLKALLASLAKKYETIELSQTL